MIKVYAAADAIDAQLVCDCLRDRGIDAEVRGAYLSGASGELPPGELLSVWIADERDRDLARRIIDEREARRRQPAAARPCPACGEHCDGHFDLCWACGAELPPA